MSKTIVLFYSLEGNTRKVGELLSKDLDLPLEEIKPVKEISSSGFSKYLWGGSQVIMNKKPDLVEIKTDLDDYDTVILGSPIWAGSFTPPIKSLLEDGALKNKKVAFFYCHDGGPGKAEEKIRQAVNINNELISLYGLARVKDGLEKLKDGLLSWAREIK